LNLFVDEAHVLAEPMENCSTDVQQAAEKLLLSMVLCVESVQCSVGRRSKLLTTTSFRHEKTGLVG